MRSAKLRFSASAIIPSSRSEKSPWPFSFREKVLIGIPALVAVAFLLEPFRTIPTRMFVVTAWVISSVLFVSIRQAYSPYGKCASRVPRLFGE